MGCRRLEGEAGWYCGVVITVVGVAEIHTGLP